MGEFLAGIYDPLIAPLDPLGLRKWRKWAVRGASGTVLEVGIGTGLNLKHYSGAGRVVAIDPDGASLSRAQTRAENSRLLVQLVQAGAEDLPFPDAAFDMLIGTLVFCTIPDPERAFQQALRVLKPGGRVRLFEHVRVDKPLIGSALDIATPAWRYIAGGCHLNRDTVGIVRNSGLHILAVHRRLGGLLVGIDAVKPIDN